MEGIIARGEKPSNTEVLGMLIDEEKLKFITKINNTNLKGILKLQYLVLRLKNPDKDAMEIHNQVMEDYLTLKCTVPDKKGNRADQIVDALKHIIDDENKDDISSISDQIRK